MFESAVANILNNVLGDYVANLESQQLNIGIWRGDVVLHNLRLRKEALDKFHLPIDVLEGYLGELTLKIPWHNLKNRPIQIKLKDVYLLATPKTETQYNMKVEEEREYQAKMRKLETAELISEQPHQPALNVEEKKEHTFISQLITKITDNLQFSIENIHIRYEDRASNPEHPFAVGLTLTELSAVSTDDNWQEAFVDDSKSSIHKLLTLGSLAVYCTTDSKSLAGLPLDEAKKLFTDMISANSTDKLENSYIMKPISGVGRVIVNKHFGGTKPRNDIRISFDEMAFSINEEQYRDALDAAALFQLYARQTKYRQFRPPLGITPKSNPAPWFRFAGKAILHEVHERRRKWTWDYFKERRENRKNYIRIWSASKLGRTLTHEEYNLLAALERKLSFDDLRLYRSIARVGIKKERALMAKHEASQPAAVAASAASWIGSWWHGSQKGHKEHGEESTLAPSEMTEEQRKHLYDTIGYDDSTAEHAFDVPENTSLHSMRAHLRKASLSILRGKESQYAPLLEIMFVDVAAAFLQRPSSYAASMALGGMAVRDGATESTHYPYLVRGKDVPEGMPKSVASSEWEGTDNIITPDAVLSRDSLFRLFYEHAPLDRRADNCVSVRARPLVITYNPSIVDSVVKCFQPPSAELDSVNALLEAAGTKFEGFKAQTRAGLEYALDKHKTMDLQVQIDAPIFVFPESVTVADGIVLVADSGHVAVASEFASSETKAHAQELLGRFTENSSAVPTQSDPELERLLYDRFRVDLTSVQVLLGNSLSECIEALRATKATKHHVVEQVGVNAEVKISIIPQARQFTKLKISGHLPNLKVNLSDRKYKNMMRIVDLVGSSDTNSAALDEESRRKPEIPVSRQSDRFTWRSEETLAHGDDLTIGEDSEDEFYDAPDGIAGVDHRDRKPAREDPDRRLLEFDFTVDSLSASLRKASSEAKEADKVLAEVTFSGFMISMVKHPFDMSVNVILRSLMMTDMSEPENSPFRMLATSNPPPGEVIYGGNNLVAQVKSKQEGESRNHDLVRIAYTKVEKAHPDYFTRYNGVDQSIDAEFAMLHVVVTSRSILGLYDFMLAAFVGGSPKTPKAGMSVSASQSSELGSDASDGEHGVGNVEGKVVSEASPSLIHKAVDEPHVEEKVIVQQKAVLETTVVKARMQCVSLVLNNDGNRIGTAMFKALDASVHLLGDTIRVNARLGGMSLRDDTSTGKMRAFRHLLDMQSNEAAYFRYETFSANEENYPGYDSSIYLRAGSARVTFLENAVKEIMDFASRFAAMHILFEKAREAAAESAAQLSEQAKRLHFDVQVESPIVVFPRNATSEDILTANLGKLKVSNVFIPLERGPVSVRSETSEDRDEVRYVDRIKIFLNAIRLVSIVESGRKENELQIIKDVDTSVDIAYTEHVAESQIPVMEISGQVSDIIMQLTEVQYRMLLDVSQSFGRAFGSEDTASERDAEQEAQKVMQLPSGAPESQRSRDRQKIQRAPTEVWTSMDVTFKLPSVQLEIYRGEGDKSPDLSQYSIARFCLNSAMLKLSMNTANALQLEFQLRSLTVNDTRPDLQNKFKEIIPACSNNNEQFMVSYRNAPGQGATAVVTVDTPKVIFVFDHLFALQHFFMDPLSNSEVEMPAQQATEVPLNSKPSTSRNQLKQAKTSQLDNSTDDLSENSALSFRVNIVDSEILVLDDPHNSASEAIFLSANQIVLSQQGIMALTVDQIGLFLCRMDKREETTLRLIENFDISLTLESRSRKGYNVVNMAIDMNPIVARVSFRDALLVTGILAKVNELRAQAAGVEGGQGAVEETSIGDLIASNESGDSEGDNRSIVVSRESLKLCVQGIQAIIIDDLNDLNMPMIDMNLQKFDVDVSDWSSQLKMDTSLQLSTNYFNIKNSTWEPLIEPWEFNISVSQQQSEAVIVDFYSRTRLEVDVNHAFIETLLTMSELWGKREQRTVPKVRGQLAPYVIQNRSGYPVHVWPETTSKKKETAIQTIPSGGDLNFRFEDWRTMRESTSGVRNRIGLQFEGVLWESLKDVLVDREGSSTYILRPKIDQVSHRLVVDVKLKENVKYVILRSALVLQNRTTVAVEMTILDAQGNMSPIPSKITPGEECAVPIEAAYHYRLRIRPAGYGYAWSKEMVYWRHLISDDSATSVHCDPYDSKNSSFRFQIRGVVDEKNDHPELYPVMAIRLSPPIELENLLPYDIRFHIYDKNRGGPPFSAELAKGTTSPVYFAEMLHLLLIGVEIPATDYRPSELAILSSPTDEFDIDKTITLADTMGLKLVLGIQSYEVPDSGGAMKYSIYSPYVMLNKTGLDLFFKEKTLLHSTKIAAGQSARRREHVAKPFMFSFTGEFAIKNRVMVKTDDSEWSKPMSFEAVGSVTELRIPCLNKSEEIDLGISIAAGEGRYTMTKVITFTPRFILKNNLPEEILVREPGQTTSCSMKQNEKTPLHFLRQGHQRQLTLCYPGLHNEWSAPFNIADVGKIHVKVCRNGGSDIRLLHVSILLEGATIFVVFNENKGEWPYRIVNDTDVDVTFYQHDHHAMDELVDGASGRSQKQYRLAAGSEVRYAWDYPSLKHKVFILNVNGREREINIAEIGQLEPLKYPAQNGFTVMALDVIAEGTTQILRLHGYNEMRSVYRPKRSNSISSIATKDGFEIVDVASKTSLVCQLRLEGIGISVINRRMQELIYASFRGVEFTYTDTSIHTSIGVKIKWLQIDNQLYGGLDPIILYPTVIPRVGRETESHPMIHAAIVKSKDTSHGVDYYKYFSALLQEVSVDIDEDFLFALLDFLKFNVHGWDNHNEGVLCGEVLELPEPVDIKAEATQMYFEGFEIHPLKVNISFVRTDRVNQEGERPRSANIVGFLVNILTMAIGNINDAPIKLNALQLENLRVSFPVLVNRIQSHYGQEIKYQLHKLVGSADVLGNPVGLFNTISSGLTDVFYEPYQGFVSDRPQDFGIGLARGTTSFFKKTVYGFSDSFAKFTGSVGKGLSAATLDKAYQDRRRISRARNKPKHVLGGVSEGGKTLLNSVSSGFTGIVRQPFQGAEQSGVGGFFKGIGKGLVGVVVKPAVGVFDLASTLTEGIKNTTTVFDENEIDRMRLPRFIGRDGVLKPYSSHDALGLMWLKELENGRFFYEDYVAHVEIPQDEKVAMLTFRRIMLFKSSRLRNEWDVRFSDLKSVRCEPTGLVVVGRHSNVMYDIPIPDGETRAWFYRKVEETIQAYNVENRSLE